MKPTPSRVFSEEDETTLGKLVRSIKETAEKEAISGPRHLFLLGDRELDSFLARAEPRWRDMSREALSHFVAAKLQVIPHLPARTTRGSTGRALAPTSLCTQRVPPTTHPPLPPLFSESTPTSYNDKAFAAFCGKLCSRQFSLSEHSVKLSVSTNSYGPVSFVHFHFTLPRFSFIETQTKSSSSHSVPDIALRSCPSTFVNNIVPKYKPLPAETTVLEDFADTLHKLMRSADWVSGTFTTRLPTGFAYATRPELNEHVLSSLPYQCNLFYKGKRATGTGYQSRCLLDQVVFSVSPSTMENNEVGQENYTFEIHLSSLFAPPPPAIICPRSTLD